MSHETLIRYLFYLILITLLSESYAQQRCAAAQHDTLMGKRYATWVMQRKMLIDSVNAFMRDPQQQRNARFAACEVIKIPVVVHVIHNNVSGNTGGSGNANISEAQILSQIKALNDDFRRKSGSRGFKHPLGVDTGIEFFLAKTDPSGKATTGITRTYLSQTDFDINTDDKLITNKVGWPTDRYLNIWVARYRGDFLGLAQFPSVPNKEIKGLDNRDEFLDKTDGLYVDYRVFGTTGALTNSKFGLGRTTTHEIGHWMGLLHTWGDTFCGDDYCDDVPTAERGNQANTCPTVYSNCNGKRTQNLIENYMDYSADSCMSVFTACQAARMRATLEKSPRRARLVRAACAQLPSVDNPYIEVFPNPTAADITAYVYIKDFADYTVELYDLAGRRVFQEKYPNYPSWKITIPSDKLSDGTYVVVVRLPDQVFSKKIVLIR